MTTEICPTCDRPIATQHDWDTIPEGEGDHLCWGEGDYQCTAAAVDWRERAAAAEARVYDLEGALQETATFAGAYRSALQEIADQETDGLEPHVFAYAILNPE